MDLERVEAILRLLRRQSHVGELSAEGEGWSVRARLGAAPFSAGVPLPELLNEPPAAEDVEERSVVRAERVGVFRDLTPPLRPGDPVARGGTVGNIDSLHILNPVIASENGYVAEALVEDGDPVEYGQELFVLRPEGSPAEE